MQRFPDIEVLVRDVRKIAIPEKTMLGFVGEIGERIFSSSRTIRGSVIVDAETGDLVLLDDFKAEARVRGLELKDNPRTEAQVDYDNILATQVGNTIHFEPNPLLDCDPPAWIDFRMGSETRFTVQHLTEFTGADGREFAQPNQITVGGCSSGTPPPRFLSAALFPDFVPRRFIAQDLIVKTSRVLDAIDPLMGELITHGASHSYSWNHHPDVPEIAHRSPLIIAINSSSLWQDVPGIYFGVWYSEDDTNVLELPVPHPLVYVCRNANGDIVSCSDPDVAGKEQYGSLVVVRSPFPFHTRVFFHEIGHYYDNFNAHGILGENLREIVPQLFSLYLHRKLYPQLTYTLSTLPEEGHCDLGFLISHSAGVVVHPDCISDLSDIARSIVVANNGYSIKAFTQAYWSLLFGVMCSVENNAVVCVQPDNLPPNYADRWMEALLFALQMGNDQSFVEFWENMELFIESNYPDDLDLIQSVRAFHGL